MQVYSSVVNGAEGCQAISSTAHTDTHSGRAGIMWHYVRNGTQSLLGGNTGYQNVCEYVTILLGLLIAVLIRSQGRYNFTVASVQPCVE